MNKNDKFHNNIPDELNDNQLDQVAGGAGNSYRYSHDIVRPCAWCGNTGTWKIYVNTEDPEKEKGVCQTCGNAGYLWTPY